MKNKDTNRLIFQTLKPLKKLLEKYEGNVPVVSDLTETDVSWINEQQRIIWENIKSSKFSYGFEEFGELNDKTLHIEEDLSEKELSELWEKTFPKLEPLKKRLEQAIQKETENQAKRNFQNFGTQNAGNAFDRQQLLDAIEDKCDLEVPEEEKTEFPENVYGQNSEEILNELLAADGNAEYVQNHPGLSKNIQTDILEWIKGTDKKLDSENPFKNEEIFLNDFKSWESQKVQDELKTVQKNYEKFNKVSESGIDFEFYEKEFEEAEKIQDDEEKSRRKKAVAEKLKEDAEKSLIERKTAWQLKRIDEFRKKFMQELQEKLANFKKLEQRLSSICGETGFLWDMAKGVFKDCGFDVLNKYADLLQKDKSLLELARILGKHGRAEVEYEKELREKTVFTTEYHPRKAFKGQIAGLQMSNDISSVLPSELALLKNPKTRKLFELKFAQKQLLSFKYENQASSTKSRTEYEEVSREKKEDQKGPIIICVDTSGSMNGTPETVAKSITFALAKVAFQEKRKCYLINFSTGIETLNLSDFTAKGVTPLETLAKFLRMSFNGGTDVEPALNHALKMLKDDDYKSADVLMISDFCTGNLSPAIEKKIKVEQEKDTDFYSLVIGSSGNQKAISCFNHNWAYNENDPNSARKLVEQMHKVKNRRKGDTGNE